MSSFIRPMNGRKRIPKWETRARTTGKIKYQTDNNNNNNIEMRRFSKGLLLLSVAFGAALTSCSDDNPWEGSDTEGGISLNLSTDGRVMRQTRADDSVSPVVPDGSQFAVKLQKSDGSYSKSWTSTEAFNREDGFPIGDYTLEASYGDIEKEGFDFPYYKGSTEVHVAPGAVSEASVTATLANAMVSIRYTDDFVSNFPSYSSAVQTEGHDWVIFAQNETRPAYVAPSEVKLNLTLTNESGERVTVQPAGFTARARHHYVVTIGVTGSSASGNLALDVTFDEDVVAETVNVPLGDELWTAPAPTVTAKGFTPETPITTFEQATISSNPEFNVFAFGGLRQATFTVVSSGYTPVFGRSVDLVGCDALTQSQLESAGVASSFRNVDKMGVLNLKKFIEQLPAGSYRLELQAVDNLTRTSEPLAMQVTVNPVEIEMEAPVKAEFMATELSVDVVTNCPDIKDNVTFMAPDANNRMVNAPVKSVTQVSGASGARTRADLGYRYRYVLQVASIQDSSVDVQLKLGTKTREVAVPVNISDFSLECDAFARLVKIRVNVSGNDLATIVENLKFFNGSTQISAGNISRNAETGIVTISGLIPATKYSGFRAVLGKISKNAPEFTTEATTDVTNGDFSATTKTIDINPINAGGSYKYVGVSHTNRSSILVYEPTGWASINQKTAYAGSATLNTWFVVPSTLASDGVVELRSVAYDHNGSMPAEDNHKVSVRNKYSRNAPTSFAHRDAGELFLGSYSYTGTESRTDGILFGSRPGSLTFKYKYESYNNESGEALIYVLDAEGNVIAGESVALPAKSAYTTVTVPLTYKDADFGKKCAKLRIGFRSTRGSSVSTNTPSGEALEDVNTTVPYEYQTIGTNEYKSLSVGSKLWIDNVKLNYDGGAAKATQRKVTKRRR